MKSEKTNKSSPVLPRLTFGVYRNVVAAKDGTILAGHGVVLAARKAGLKEIPVIRLDVAPNSTAAIKVLVGDNEMARLAVDNDESLGFLLKQLKATDPDGLLGTGFEDKTLAELLGEGDAEPEVPEPQLDKAKQLQKKWKTARGQIWEISTHRLMCGDSCDSKDTTHLMTGKKAALFCTDPPYGVAYGDLIQEQLNRTRHWDRIESDNLSGEDTQKFLESVFRAWLPFLSEKAAWYLWHAQKVQGYFTAAAAAAAGVLYHRQIVWVKPQMVFGRGHFHWRHELCLYGWRKGHESKLPEDRGATTVWEFARDVAATYRHPTQKPVECFTWPMKYSTVTGNLCAEPFAGSGTQLCAAQTLKRVCYAMEIEPKYVAVALERLSEMGLKPKLVKPKC